MTQADRSVTDRSMSMFMRLRRSVWWLWASRVLAAAVIVITGYYVFRKLAEGYDQLQTLAHTPDYRWIAAAIVVLTLCVLLGGWEWGLMLRAMGYKLPMRKALRIQASANLAKYVPGYAWQIVGKGYLCTRVGIPGRLAAFSISLEFAIIAITGIMTAILFLPFTELVSWSVMSRTLIKWIGLAGATLLLMVIPRLVLRPPLRQWARIEDGSQRPGLLCLALAAVLCTWILLGLGFSALVASVYPVRLTDVPLYIVALVISILSGLAAVIVPAGWGVREMALIIVLEQQIPPAIATSVTLLVRLAFVAAEILAFAVTSPLK